MARLDWARIAEMLLDNNCGPAELGVSGWTLGFALGGVGLAVGSVGGVEGLASALAGAALAVAPSFAPVLGTN